MIKEIVNQINKKQYLVLFSFFLIVFVVNFVFKNIFLQSLEYKWEIISLVALIINMILTRGIIIKTGYYSLFIIGFLYVVLNLSLTTVWLLICYLISVGIFTVLWFLNCPLIPIG